MNPWSLTEDQMFALYHAIPKMSAVREIRERQVASLPTAERSRQLTLDLTGDQKQADEAWAAFILSELRSGNNPRGV